MKNAKAFEHPLHFDVCSRNGRMQYHLIAMRTPNGLKFTCTCDASQRGRVCSHRLRLAAGDETLLFGPREHLIELQGMVANTPLPIAVQELRRLERERHLIAGDIDRQRQFLVQLMSG